MLTSQLPSMKLSFLKAYSFFVNFLMEDLSSVEKYCGHYIVRHIIHTSIYLLQGVGENWESAIESVRITFDVLSLVLLKLFDHPVVCEEVIRCLCFLVNNLIHFAINYQTFEGNRSLELLQQLILVGTSDDMSLYDFTNAVSQLDLLPGDEDMFLKLNERLEVLKATVIEQDPKKVSVFRFFTNL